MSIKPFYSHFQIILEDIYKRVIADKTVPLETYLVQVLQRLPLLSRVNNVPSIKYELFSETKKSNSDENN